MRNPTLRVSRTGTLTRSKTADLCEHNEPRLLILCNAFICTISGVLRNTFLSEEEDKFAASFTHVLRSSVKQPVLAALRQKQKTNFLSDHSI